MDNFLHLTDERKEENKKANPTNTYVDRERIQRLKRNFLPFWMRWIEEQKGNHNESPLKRDPAEQL